ncbi:PREDICTED: ribonuclease Z, mitochondrial isoform X2 [Eufriesea mexicana]|nr:PREDICTED: ribonuclease Z, mitochondrial isoform X2 [Eufriesea mexicana]
MALMKQRKQVIKSQINFQSKLKVVGSGALGTPSAIYLLTDHINHLFNCGESIQRLSQEHQCKISKLHHIFITSSSWRNVGGLPGMLLTAQAGGLTEINIHGPVGLDSFVKTTKLFINLPDLKINFNSITEFKTYRNKVMQVTYVPIVKSAEDIKDSSSNLVDTNYINVNGKRVIDNKEEENMQGGKKIKINPRVICYICDIHPKQGKLLIDKCIDFGIPPGPLLHKLKSGQDVTKEDGTIVYSKDVVDPEKPITTFIVVECPTREYLDSLVNDPTLLMYQRKELMKEDVFCIFHFTPEKVFTEQRYQDWLNAFGSNTQHIILNDENTCMGSEAVYKNQYLLNMLHSELFPLLKVDNFQKDKETNNDAIHRARGGQVLCIRPTTSHLIYDRFYNKPQIYIDEILKIPTFPDVLKELKTNIEEKSRELNLSNNLDYPRIVMLGTGCSVPNKVRNTSGILVRVNKDTSILLDCGEGTLSQIIRFYGISEGINILCTIKAIYISHIHADHHLGLIGLLLKRKMVTDEVLYLLTPKCIMPWFNFYNDRFESITEQYTIVDNNSFYQNYHTFSLISEIELYHKLDIKEINTIFVKHCNQSYGIAITLKDNKKIVYSGDTVFSKNLIQLGQNCDLLIHEATMENGLEDLANRKFHSTTSGAIKAGKLMNAKFILLTHFSQRYAKIPSIPENETAVGVAYDFMELTLSNLQLLPLLNPCLKVMFNEYNKVMND